MPIKHLCWRKPFVKPAFVGRFLIRQWDWAIDNGFAMVLRTWLAWSLIWERVGDISSTGRLPVRFRPDPHPKLHQFFMDCIQAICGSANSRAHLERASLGLGFLWGLFRLNTPRLLPLLNNKPAVIAWPPKSSRPSFKSNAAPPAYSNKLGATPHSRAHWIMLILLSPAPAAKWIFCKLEERTTASNTAASKLQIQL